MNLLEPQAFTLKAKIINIAIFWVIKFIWYTFIAIFLKQYIFDSINKVDFFFIVLLGPLVEEVIYRWFPITVATKLGKEYVLPAIVLSSIIFGLRHEFGLLSVLIQGVGGFMYSILFIRNNYCLTSTFVGHSSWNLFTLI